jgi:hypothetical protein
MLLRVPGQPVPDPGSLRITEVFKDRERLVPMPAPRLGLAAIEQLIA